MDLGRTMKEMYPSASDAKNQKHYPRISVPKKMFGKEKLNLEDVHNLGFKAKIVGHSPESDEVHMELMEGEHKGQDNAKEEKAEGETYLGKA
jgi:hypothetical protein